MEVTLRPLSDWQKRDCINRSADYDCPDPAIWEAVCLDVPPGVTSAVRCCGNGACQERAQVLANVASSVQP